MVPETKKQVFVGIIMASTLLVGFVLSSVMAVVALCFLMSGCALPVSVMGLVWVAALAIWLFGALPALKYIDEAVMGFGIVVFIVTLLWLVFATAVAPIYGTVGLPIVFGALMFGTFMNLLLKFSGVIPEDVEAEAEVKPETK